MFNPSVVIVDDLDLAGTRGPIRPREADPPLVIDPDAVLANAGTPEGLESVSRKCAEILQRPGDLQSIQPDFRLSCEPGKLFDENA